MNFEDGFVTVMILKFILLAYKKNLFHKTGNATHKQEQRQNQLQGFPRLLMIQRSMSRILGHLWYYLRQRKMSIFLFRDEKSMKNQFRCTQGK